MARPVGEIDTTGTPAVNGLLFVLALVAWGGGVWVAGVCWDAYLDARADERSMRQLADIRRATRKR